MIRFWKVVIITGFCWLVHVQICFAASAINVTTRNQDVQLTLVPELTQIDHPGTITIAVMLENKLAKEIQSVDFTLVNSAVSSKILKPVPDKVAPNSLIVGQYSVYLSEEATYAVVGRLTYIFEGRQYNVVSRTDVKLQADQKTLRDLWLVLVGAIASILGGIVAEAIKGWFERRRQVRQQANKALGLLIPGIDICIHAVENNRDAPVSVWQEIYLKEGLYTALIQKAKSSTRSNSIQNIAQLYARLNEYNTNKQFVNRAELISDLKTLQTFLQELI